MNDVPPELRGVSRDPMRERTTPNWVRVTALVALVAMILFVLWTTIF